MRQWVDPDESTSSSDEMGGACPGTYLLSLRSSFT